MRSLSVKSVRLQLEAKRNQMNTKFQRYLKRKNRVRRKISGSVDKPRLTVTRSLKNISCQLVDDVNGVTLAAVSSNSKEVKEIFNDKKHTKTEVAKATGRLLAEKAKAKGIKKAVFDRNGYMFHGRIKAVADGFKDAELTI